MKKPKTPRDIQVRHRLSGAALLGMREPMAPTMAIDAAPRAEDVTCPKCAAGLACIRHADPSDLADDAFNTMHEET